MWSFLHVLGVALNVDMAFEDEDDREAARNFKDLLATPHEAEEN